MLRFLLFFPYFVFTPDRPLRDLQHYLAASVPGLIEFVSLSSFGQRQHLLDHGLDFRRIDERSEFSQPG